MKAREIVMESGEVVVTPKRKIERTQKMAPVRPVPGGKRMGPEKGPVESMAGTRDIPEEPAGPYANVYVTKLMTRTSDKIVETLLGDDPDRAIKMRNYDFFTFLLNTTLQIQDPASTRLEFARINFDFSNTAKILKFSPDEKGISVEITQTTTNEIKISPTLSLSAAGSVSTETTTDTGKNTVKIEAGPKAELTGSYSKTDGYVLKIPSYNLLEYQGFQTSPYEVNWEIYENHVIKDGNIPGRGKYAVFSVIVQTPKDTHPGISAHVDGRVKKKKWLFEFEGSIYYKSKDIPQGS